MHGEGVTSNKISTEIYSLESVEVSVETGELCNIITDEKQETLCDICFLILGYLYREEWVESVSVL